MEKRIITNQSNQEYIHPECLFEPVGMEDNFLSYGSSREGLIDLGDETDWEPED